eukprot:COSAG02_NODE_8865_length_2417_cov_2.731665_2_plen_47_part_01
MRGPAAENSVDVRRNSFISCAAPPEAGCPEGLLGKRRARAGEAVLIG